MFKKDMKLITKILVAAMCTSLMPTTIAFANTEENVTSVIQTIEETSAESDFTFDASTGTITKYIGSDTTVIIPSTINGVSVTSIGEYVFQHCTSLTNVTIPSSVISIGERAFYYCESLLSITIQDGLISIGKEAFFVCNNLKSVTIPSSVISIGEFAFGDESVFGNYYKDTLYYAESVAIKQLLIKNGINQGRIILNSELSPVSVTSIKLNNTSLNMVMGNTAVLTATVLPSEATNRVIWKSSDTNVAVVDENGTVKVIGLGTVTIKCTAVDGSGQSATCLVTSTSYNEFGKNTVQIGLKSGSIAGYYWKYNVSKDGIIKIGPPAYISDFPNNIQVADGFYTSLWRIIGLKEGSTTVTFERSPLSETRTFLFTVDKDLAITVKEITANKLLGDINSDSKIDILDYIVLKKYIMNNSVNINKQNTDINQDMKIDILDYLALKKLI